VIAVAVRWYLRYGLSHRDVEELLAERGVTVDHVTVYRWVQTFTPEFVDAARAARHLAGDRWFVDETCVKISGRWHCLCRAIDQAGQRIDVMLPNRHNAAAAQAFSLARCVMVRRRLRSPPTRRRSTRVWSRTPSVRRGT
jgi:transposase-like protein